MPLLQKFAFFSLSRCYLHPFFFHFPSSSSSPFDKPRKAHVCFSLSLWIVSLHHLVNPKEIGSLDNFTASFLLQLQAKPPVSFPVPISGWAVQAWAMWELGMFLPASPMSFLAAIVPGKIRGYCIQGENLQKPAFSREFTFLTSKTKLAERLLLQLTVPISCLKTETLASLKYVKYSACIHIHTHVYLHKWERHENTSKKNIAFYFILIFFNRPVQALDPFDYVSFQGK